MSGATRRSELSDDELRLILALEAMGHAIRQRYECLSRDGIECGGRCHLPKGHDPALPHLCCGDVDGPGSCPA